MPQRALITGASGFVGGFLAEHLLECGDAVLGCSPDGRWMAGNEPDAADSLELVPWDLGHPQGLAEADRRRIEQFRPEVIYHLAALSVPEDCGRDEPTPKATAVNVDGTCRVLRLAASLPRPARVLMTSTSLVYAPVEARSARVDERARLGPWHGYGKSKLAAEEEARRAARQQNCDVVIVRPFQHTGPRQDSRMMLPSWSRQFAEGGTEPVRVYTLDARVDLTDVRDVVRAYRLLAEHGRRGEVYNVGRGVEHRTGDVLGMLRELAGSDRPVVQTRPGFQQNPIADITKLVEATGWQAEIPLEKTVADTFHWWQRQLARKKSLPHSGNLGD